LAYREEHLETKSNQCASLWCEWFALFENIETKHTKATIEARKKWCECVTEFGKMVSEEVKTNPRYRSMRKI
jgi:hypothetical protein